MEDISKRKRHKRKLSAICVLKSNSKEFFEIETAIIGDKILNPYLELATLKKINNIFELKDHSQFIENAFKIIVKINSIIKSNQNFSISQSSFYLFSVCLILNDYNSSKYFEKKEIIELVTFSINALLYSGKLLLENKLIELIGKNIISQIQLILTKGKKDKAEVIFYQIALLEIIRRIYKSKHLNKEKNDNSQQYFLNYYETLLDISSIDEMFEYTGKITRYPKKVSIVINDYKLFSIKLTSIYKICINNNFVVQLFVTKAFKNFRVDMNLFNTLILYGMNSLSEIESPINLFNYSIIFIKMLERAFTLNNLKDFVYNLLFLNYSRFLKEDFYNETIIKAFYLSKVLLNRRSKRLVQQFQ